MHAFDVLGDPVRRRILELLADGEQTSGAITGIIRAEFGISQPAAASSSTLSTSTPFLPIIRFAIFRFIDG